jgi:plasmid stabilization system protein ParE
MRPAAPEKRLEWSPRALDAYLSTLARIAEEDPFTARRFMERVERSLSVILSQPGIGTPATRRGERRYPIPNTGHVVNYRVTRSAVRIRLWYRARQHVAARQR